MNGGSLVMLGVICGPRCCVHGDVWIGMLGDVWEGWIVQAVCTALHENRLWF